MTKHLALLALVGLLAACAEQSANPVNGDDPVADDGAGDGGDPADPGGDDGAPIESDRALPPGTASPTPEVDIFRREARDAEGNGFAEAISYDSDADTFTVDNLAFDGDNTFARDDQVGSLGPYALYENDSFFDDPYTGVPIGQLSHKALYGVSRSGETEFAIVRTGAYVDYGFGGFIYQRNNDVTLPTTGQAAYAGPYAGLRDFNGRGGMEYVIAEMTMDIDFEDFNDGDAVKGAIFNRSVFDTTGRDVTEEILNAIEEQTENQVNALPTLRFVTQAGVLDANGELSGQLNS